METRAQKRIRLEETKQNEEMEIIVPKEFKPDSVENLPKINIEE